MDKAMLIVNPNSGKKEGRALSERVAAHLGEHFSSVDVRLSSCAAESKRGAREAQRAGIRRLVRQGGDGTVA